MGKVFTHFPKPAKRFVEECIYGIQASGDTKLSSIVRAIDDDIRPIYTEKRLSRNLDDDTLEQAVAGAVLKVGARSVRGDTLLLVDPTYAIADGLRRAFTRFGRWIRAAALTTAADTEPPPAPLLPGFADLFDIDDG